MKFPSRLQNGTFLKRYKRFFADLEWNGQIITAHVANTGSLRGCIEPGSACRFSVSDDPARKLKYSLEMIQTPQGTWVGVNTSHPNKIVKEALEKKLLPHWDKYVDIRPEAKIDAKTRFDFEAKLPSGLSHYIEVKNVTMAENGRAMFPDSVTERGQKHLRELMRLAKAGHGTEVVFTVQRDDAKSFAPADLIDPEYGKLLREAHAQGVRLTVLQVELAEDGIHLTDRSLELELAVL